MSKWAQVFYYQVGDITLTNSQLPYGNLYLRVEGEDEIVNVKLTKLQIAELHKTLGEFMEGPPKGEGNG